MSNTQSMLMEIKSLKNQLGHYQRMFDKQINPPICVTNVDFKAQFEQAIDEINRFKPVPFTGGKLFIKSKEL